MSRLRLGTRGSPLALAQARAVAAALPLSPELVVVETAGDRLGRQSPAPLDDPAGRGRFVSALEQALRAGTVDLCVHSAKDVPPEGTPGLALIAFPTRADPRDALVGRALAELAAGATVATGSPRRAAQLLALRPDLRVEAVRGNVDTRLRRTAEGGFAAALLAVAGLSRLGREDAIREVLAPEQMVPAAGQGALALQARAGDAAAAAAAAACNDPLTAFCVRVERGVLAALGGGCSAPAGVLCAPLRPGRLLVRAVVAGAAGELVRAVVEAEVAPARWTDGARADELAAEVAAALLQGGAARLLQAAGGAGGAR